MGYFAAERPTTRVTLPTSSTYWVDVYSTVKYREQQRFAALTDAEGKFDAAAALDTMLQAMIAGWNLDDDNGTVVEVTPENVGQLDKADVEAILAQIQSVIAVDEDEKKSSSKS